MLFDVGVVGRALEGEVEGDLQAELAAARDQAVEIVQRAELGVDRLVAASAPPIAQGLPGSSGPASALVRALAKAAPDRMDRRQVEHVEAHPAT